MLKKILFPIVSFFLAFRSFELCNALLNQSEFESFGFNLLWGFLLNLFVTGVFAMLGFAYPTHKVLPASYYQVKNAESLKKWYNLLGVKYFRIGLMFAFWGHKKNRTKYFNGTKSGIQNFNYQTKQSEIGHLLAFVVLVFLSLLFLFNGQWKLSMVVFLINFIGNFYPVILQRHHRIRIDKLGL